MPRKLSPNISRHRAQEEGPRLCPRTKKKSTYKLLAEKGPSRQDVFSSEPILEFSPSPRDHSLGPDQKSFCTNHPAQEEVFTPNQRDSRPWQKFPAKKWKPTRSRWSLHTQVMCKRVLRLNSTCAHKVNLSNIWPRAHCHVHRYVNCKRIIYSSHLCVFFTYWHFIEAKFEVTLEITLSCFVHAIYY